MRKVVALLLVVVFVLTFSSVAFAFTGNEDAVEAMSESDAWYVDKGGDRINHSDQQLRFWIGGNRAGEIVIPADAGEVNESPIFREVSMDGQSNIYPPGHMDQY